MFSIQNIIRSSGPHCSRPSIIGIVENYVKENDHAEDSPPYGVGEWNVAEPHEFRLARTEEGGDVRLAATSNHCSMGHWTTTQLSVFATNASIRRSGTRYLSVDSCKRMSAQWEGSVGAHPPRMRYPDNIQTNEYIIAHNARLRGFYQCLDK